MNAKLKCGWLFSIVAIAGCGGGPTLDATNSKAYEASVKAMNANMSDNQKRQFAADIMTALGPEAAQKTMKNTFSKDKTTPADPMEMFKPLQGMTAEQIQAKAEENRQRLKKQ